MHISHMLSGIFEYMYVCQYVFILKKIILQDSFYFPIQLQNAERLKVNSSTQSCVTY